MFITSKCPNCWRLHIFYYPCSFNALNTAAKNMRKKICIFQRKFTKIIFSQFFRISNFIMRGIKWKRMVSKVLMLLTINTFAIYCTYNAAPIFVCFYRFFLLAYFTFCLPYFFLNLSCQNRQL